MATGADEFGEIARLFRPLAGGAPGAFDLLDDAAIVPQRPGFDLVATKDAVVEGVHTPIGERPDLIARKLVRVNLSDLAAKGAEPFAAFLAISWPPAYGAAERESFATGLGRDLKAFGVALLGGDTVATPGPLTASLTALGWVPRGAMVRRHGARAGDLVAVSGTIGDGVLGLAAAQGRLDDPWLADRYRLPTPRLDLRAELLAGAHAAADVSDGLVADVGHLAHASGVAITLDLERLPLSTAAGSWLATQPDRTAALIRLATGGDDYEVVAALPSPPSAAFTVIGAVADGAGVTVRLDGRPVEAGAGGWTHI